MCSQVAPVWFETWRCVGCTHPSFTATGGENSTTQKLCFWLPLCFFHLHLHSPSHCSFQRCVAGIKYTRWHCLSKIRFSSLQVSDENDAGVKKQYMDTFFRETFSVCHLTVFWFQLFKINCFSCQSFVFITLQSWILAETPPSAAAYYFPRPKVDKWRVSVGKWKMSPKTLQLN